MCSVLKHPSCRCTTLYTTLSNQGMPIAILEHMLHTCSALRMLPFCQQCLTVQKQLSNISRILIFFYIAMLACDDYKLQHILKTNMSRAINLPFVLCKSHTCTDECSSGPDGTSCHHSRCDHPLTGSQQNELNRWQWALCVTSADGKLHSGAGA